MQENIQGPAQERKAYAHPVERKSAPDHGELNRAVGDFFRAFEAFKSANDERLKELESKSSADVLIEEKVDRINAKVGELKTHVDQVAAQIARPRLGGAAETQSNERKSFREFLRRGTAPSELKTVVPLASGGDGGVLIPSEIETMIARVLPKISPIRSVASVRQIGTSTLKLPFVTASGATGWVAETDARPQTDAPTITEIDYPTAELYAMPAATQALLDDSAADVETWLAEEIQTTFAEQEGAAFVNGNGTNKPKGFLQYTTVADASWTSGNIGYIASGADGAFAGSNPSDALISLVYAPRQTYRANANWVMNRTTAAAIRKFKDTAGEYIWRPGNDPGSPASLMGYPVIESEDMPTVASNSLSIAFGDFHRGYLIVDRVGIRILRDPYSAKPYVLFYATKRVGGGVMDFAAIKVMKFAAS
ncbi:MAG TPA: phage major capsid protein [Alphaproteobacteria bacterium]|nr:phage major capsid protein [Alphaproteobacteria bacterium]